MFRSIFRFLLFYSLLCTFLKKTCSKKYLLENSINKRANIIEETNLIEDIIEEDKTVETIFDNDTSNKIEVIEETNLIEDIIDEDKTGEISFDNDTSNKIEVIEETNLIEDIIEEDKTVEISFDSDISNKIEEVEELSDNAFVSSDSDIIPNFTNFYDQLNNIEKKFYDAILGSSTKNPPEFEVEVTFDYNGQNINANDYQSNQADFERNIDDYQERSFTAIIYDHPELWWIGAINSGYSYYLNNNQKTVRFNLIGNKSFTSSEIANLNLKIEAMKIDITNKISQLGLTTDYAKLKYIHDYLITKLVYVLDESRAHIRNVYGALVENKCVCEGYAEAFQYIAQQYNIDCIIARSINHEWNFVKLNSKWYVVDVTWDDPGNINGSNTPSGSNINLDTDYFLVGTNHDYYGEKYYEDESHILIYSAYDDTNHLVKYPSIETNDYTPNSTEKNEADKIDFNTWYTSTLLAIPNCLINRYNSIICPTISNYFCINGDNELYKSGGSTCKKTYTYSSNKNIVFLKDSNGYTEYTSGDTTDTSLFIIYDCKNNSNSGCTILTNDYYHDTINQHIFYLDTTNYQYKQLKGTIYNDSESGKDYICDSNGICSINNNDGYYLAGTVTSGKYNKLIQCVTTTSGRNTITNCSTEKVPTVDGYYINGAEAGKSLIYCSNTSGGSPSCYLSVSSSNIKTSGYAYLDAGNDNSINTSYGGYITCTSMKCIPQSKPSNTNEILYFIDGGINTDQNIIQCDQTKCNTFIGTYTNGYALPDGTKDGSVLLGNGNKFIQTDSNATSRINKYFIDAMDPKKIIICGYNTESKKIVCSSDNSGATASNKTYFIDAGISGNLIECNTSICTSIIPNIGFYISHNENNPLIKCTEVSKKIQCETVSKSKIKEGFYLNGSSTTNNKNYSEIISCSSNSSNCLIITTKIKGYYIYGSSSSSSSLIFCDGSSYTLLQESYIGFYLDGSSSTDNINYTQIIKCNESCITVKTKNIGYYLDGSSATSNISLSKRKGNRNELLENINSKEKRASTVTTYSKLIVCDGTKYILYNNIIHIGYYLDGSSTSDNTKYKNVISCTSSSTCSSITTTPLIKGYYLEGNSTTDNVKYNKLISYNGSYYTLLSSINIGYYLNGNSSTDNIYYNQLIYCESNTNCSNIENNNIKEGFYFEGSKATGSISSTQLINCSNDDLKTLACKMHNNIRSKTFYEPYDGYYINGMNDSFDNPLIRCSSNTCIKLNRNAINQGYYVEGSTSTINKSLYAKLISCNSSNCSILSSPDNGYYANAESTSLTKAIIFCTNNECEIQTPSTNPSYYVGVGNNIDGLIECTEPNGGATTCIYKEAFNSQGYFLNSGYNNNNKEQIILCSTSAGCQTLKADLGYYVNSGDPINNPIIKCEVKDKECVTVKYSPCPISSNSIAGDYCYEDSVLKFFASDHSEPVSANGLNDYYVYSTLLAGKFPGIKKDMTTVIKINQYYINRYEQVGIIMIDENTGRLVDSLTPGQTEESVTIYDCSDANKSCIEKKKCIPNTYMFDSENQKAIFCNNGNMEYAHFTGYVVNDSLVSGSGNNNHPYLINCINNGEICTSVKSNSSSYYENMGYDRDVKNLIQCNTYTCITIAADIGYYLANNGENVIRCTSSTALCINININSDVRYLNNGFNKSKYGIIECFKKDGCSLIPGKKGYYLISSSSTYLIKCTDKANCQEFVPLEGYYDNADSEDNSTVIYCSPVNGVITCSLKKMSTGFYLTDKPNTIFRCKFGSECQTFTPKNGFFRGAVKKAYGYSKRSDMTSSYNMEELNGIISKRETIETYGIIKCSSSKCYELSIDELAAIPICEFHNNKCYITTEYSRRPSATITLTSGNICTNSDRSIFYFATDTIVVKPTVIGGVTSTYSSTTTTTNCLEASDDYKGLYFTVGSGIYLLEESSVIPVNDIGYYFINTVKNTLVSGKNIDEYNDENVKIYKCNGIACSIEDKPIVTTYYADVNKIIIKYDIYSNSYSFIYSTNIMCTYSNNQCTPNADLINQKFCITYMGELVLASSEIKSKETGECYKANTITSNIYGYSDKLYIMNLYSAQLIDQTGYHIINLSTNSTISNNMNQDKKIRNNGHIIYGCLLSTCNAYEPKNYIYYYDTEAKALITYQNDLWKIPNMNYGYAYISVDPSNTYIYSFLRNQNNEIEVNTTKRYGNFYTIDEKMYHCEEGMETCNEIEETGYYFTRSGEIYYCIYDLGGEDDTECIKKDCISGQYYYIEGNFYLCGYNSVMSLVVSKYCPYYDNVIINFPLIYYEQFPYLIKQVMRNIEVNNNSTAIITRRGNNHLDCVSGIFTHCAYNVEQTSSSFDLICLNNYVIFDQITNDVKICSIDHLNYVECVEDEENPNKCNISSKANLIVSPSILSLIVIVIFSFINLL
ncbi:scaffoldin [Anaeromyces robustus]|uniref:Scaffoldin n=1 Tax=Anaeromyces robustus TaxID=1754192 RepID=A0A1Y1XEG0_9FUNG|nr:scaffoldin [Anaeromyces robustus]|eukprot:ORX83764.1 scaffoldin [Anaeromyces robustus]